MATPRKGDYSVRTFNLRFESIAKLLGYKTNRALAELVERFESIAKLQGYKTNSVIVSSGLQFESIANKGSRTYQGGNTPLLKGVKRRLIHVTVICSRWYNT